MKLPEDEMQMIRSSLGLRRATVAVDIDGTLCHYEGWFGHERFGCVFPGAKEFLSKLAEEFDIIIYSCRTSEEINSPGETAQAITNIQKWLESNGLIYHHIYVGKGKPIALFYVDDRAVTCSPTKDPEAFNKALVAMGLL